MAKFQLTLPVGESVVDGKQITFKSPSVCENVSTLVINGVDYTLVDYKNRELSESFDKDSIVSVIVDTVNFRACVQNIGTGSSNPDHTHSLAKYEHKESQEGTVSLVGITTVETEDDENGWKITDNTLSALYNPLFTSGVTFHVNFQGNVKLEIEAHSLYDGYDPISYGLSIQIDGVELSPIKVESFNAYFEYSGVVNNEITLHGCYADLIFNTFSSLGSTTAYTNGFMSGEDKEKLDNVYTKEEANSKFASADKVYTKAQANSAFMSYKDIYDDEINTSISSNCVYHYWNQTKVVSTPFEHALIIASHNAPGGTIAHYAFANDGKIYKRLLVRGMPTDAGGAISYHTEWEEISSGEYLIYEEVDLTKVTNVYDSYNDAQVTSNSVGGTGATFTINVGGYVDIEAHSSDSNDRVTVKINGISRYVNEPFTFKGVLTEPIEVSVGIASLTFTKFISVPNHAFGELLSRLDEVDQKICDIDSALDAILAIQESIIGGVEQ